MNNATATVENDCISYNGKHNIGNNTASMRYNGTCGACQYCTCMFTPQECFEYYQAGHTIDENLIKTLARYGYPVKGVWICSSCQQAIPERVDRIAHFKEAHNFQQ